MADKFIKKIVVRPCPICSNKTGEILHTQKFAIPKGYPLPCVYDVVSCIKCGFVYADTPARQKDYDLYYEKFSIYDDIVTASGAGIFPWDNKRFEYAALEIAKIMPDKGCSIIDIGCANGGLLAKLKSIGYTNLTGLDMSAACLEYTQRVHGIGKTIEGGVFCPTIKSDMSLHGSFDCACLVGVVEHIYDLEKAIINVSRLLRNSGILYIVVPDASRYHDFYTAPYSDFNLEHINHFDDNSLGNLLTLNGLDVVSFSEYVVNVGGTYCPCATIIGKKSGNKVSGKIVGKFAVKDSVLKCIDKSKNDLDSIRIKLEPLVRLQDPVIVWGAGNFTSRLMEDSILGKCNIIAMVDNNSKKWGSKIKGIAVSPPNKLKGFTGTLIVSSVFFSDDICAQAKSMGINNEILVLR